MVYQQGSKGNSFLERYVAVQGAHVDTTGGFPKSIEHAGINDFIAAMTHLAQTRMVAGNPDDRQGFQNLIDIFAYMRDHHQASTVAEAQSMLEQRLVDESMVASWVAQKVHINDLVFGPIKKGYPEYESAINDTIRQYARRQRR